MTTAPTKEFPSLRRAVGRSVDGLIRIGMQAQLHGKTLVSLEDAFVYYRVEMVRLIAQMSLSTGALAIIGGTVAIVDFLTLSTATLIGTQGYNQLSTYDTEALTGILSAYFVTRLLTPVIAGIGLAATIGGGATAHLGAMRINEEIIKSRCPN
jgi:phospholipid/cholesterol/gamma-HCH transport system permease protein